MKRKIYNLITNVRQQLSTQTTPSPSPLERSGVRLWLRLDLGLSLFLFLFTGLGLSAQEYRGAFHIQSGDFKEQNDSLHISFDILIDSRAVPSCASMIFEPELKDDNGNMLTFPYIQINGEQRTRLNGRWFSVASNEWLENYQPPYMLVDVNKYTGENLAYSFSVPYELWMDNASLTLIQEVTGCAGEQHLYTYTLNNRVTIESREPYQVQPLVALTTPAEESKTRNRQGSAFLDFQSGRSVILPDFRRNPVELGKIDNALTEVMADIDSRITGLFIEGYASPEGSYKTNERLARERAIALKDHIRNRYALAEQIFTVKSVAEDWEGLKAAVESNSDLPQKEQVLAIINSKDEYDVKERKLKGLTVYSRLLRDLFPELRRVEYQIDYAVRSYNNAEARALVGISPEKLSQAELYRVAESYGKESPEYRQIIIETIPQYYPNDAVALSNAAALLIENREENTALRMLEKAQGVPAAWNNLGAVYLLRGELEKAEALFNQAAVAGVKEAAHNLEELKTKKEDNAKRESKGR